jgi:hypothetical protein
MAVRPRDDIGIGTLTTTKPILSFLSHFVYQIRSEKHTLASVQLVEARPKLFSKLYELAATFRRLALPPARLAAFAHSSFSMVIGKWRTRTPVAW